MPPHDDARAALAKLDFDELRGLRGQSLLLTSDWSTAQLTALVDLARAFELLDRAGVKTPLFLQELAYALFFDNSTRTKSSWAGASARLGSHPVIVDGSSTQVEHGETAEETGAMLGMNAHALGIRHDLILGEGNAFMRAAKQGIDAYLEAIGDPRSVPVVNLQCDVDHPTQTLADLCQARERLGDLRGKKIAMSWAYSPSYAKPLSVPQGVITLFTRFGAEVVLAHPQGYDLLPGELEKARAFATASGGRFELTHDMDAAFAAADIVYPKSWGPYELMLERVAANRAHDREAMAAIERRCLAQNAENRGWICDERRMAATRGGAALYMHCLPADIGAEVSPAVMGRARLDVAREANKKVYVIMALLSAAKHPNLEEELAKLLGA